MNAIQPRVRLATTLSLNTIRTRIRTTRGITSTTTLQEIHTSTTVIITGMTRVTTTLTIGAMSHSTTTTLATGRTSMTTTITTTTITVIPIIFTMITVMVLTLQDTQKIASTTTMSVGGITPTNTLWTRRRS